MCLTRLSVLLECTPSVHGTSAAARVHSGYSSRNGGVAAPTGTNGAARWRYGRLPLPTRPRQGYFVLDQSYVEAVFSSVAVGRRPY